MNTKTYKTKRRHANGLTPISTSIQASCIERLEQNQLQTYQLFVNWSLIVGADQASEIRPLKTTSIPGERGFILHVQPCKAGAEFLLQYQQQPLIEAINNYFGQSLIKALRIVKGPYLSDHPEKKKEPEIIQPPAQMSDALSNSIGSVNNPDLQDKLKSFYQSFMQSKNQ